MAELQKGQKLQLIEDAGEIEIVKFIDGGGQGEVYEVLHEGKRYALKWYTNVLYKGTMYEIALRNLHTMPPDKNFLWPLYVTEKDREKESFGYVMQLYDSRRYKSLCDLRHSKSSGVRYASWEVMFRTAYNICVSFSKLHAAGYTYMDINDKNIVVDPQTGDILICDTDNCVPAVGELDPGIIGTPGFMAPEVLMGLNRPNARSDRFSLAVLLFEIFYVDHPLEGKMTWGIPLNDKNGAEMFGKHATFVMLRSGNNPNGPKTGYTDTVENRWNKNMYPPDMKKLFLRAFTDGLDSSNRIMETEWIQMLVKARGMMLTYPDGVKFVNGYLVEKLPAHSYVMQCGGNRIVLADKSRLYAIQLGHEAGTLYRGDMGQDSFSHEIARVVASTKNPAVLAIMNEMEHCTWQVKEKGKEPRMLGFHEYVVLSHGMQFSIHGATFTVVSRDEIVGNHES